MRREAGTMLSEIPIPFSPVFPSDIPGRSELPAEVPASYRTPTPSPYEVLASYRTPTPTPNTASTQNEISRENTQGSTYSIPIGLGVSREGSKNPPQNYSVYYPVIPTPAQPQSQPQTQTQPQQFNIYTPTPEQSPYNTNSDTFKIKTIDIQPKRIQSYDGAYDDIEEGMNDIVLSPMDNGRWSGSTVSGGGGGEGDGMMNLKLDTREVDELTPLSQVYRESWSERGSWCQR
jgi:hypothetical protein